MQIVCPHCTTAYAVNSATIGAAGRTVRCSRCKEIWLARPEGDAIERADPVAAMAETRGARAGSEIAAGWAEARDDVGRSIPDVESPPIAGNWQAADDGSQTSGWTSTARDKSKDRETAPSQHRGIFRRSGARPAKPLIRLPTVCAAMGALVVALVFWRADVVRLMPQTASFYRLVGLEVNLRGLSFRDVRVTTEDVGGKPVLVIEGSIMGETGKAVDLPRLRFSVRDAQGTEIYAWNTVLDQTVLKPGERTSFKSRLASPPAEGKSIDVRFFTKRDIAGGNI
jgi:predicted Zn finger-like uncharacterized protein